MVMYENRLMSLRQNQTETLGDAQFHEINEKFKRVKLGIKHSSN